ncbi:MAG: precorrin-8X methylmutase [Actinomycetota bacterium]|nr:precorrin-8X methylmutase [Actinomycetota bacterium]
MTAGVHPIEAESYRILEGRVDLSGWPPGPRAVVARVVHATAALDFAATMVAGDTAVAAGVAALRAGAVVVTDVEMTRAAVTGTPAVCYLAETGGEQVGLTRSAAAMRLAATRHPQGAIFAIGCAPTALVELVRLAQAGVVAPALVVGLPVGFVGAAEAKDFLVRSGIPAVSNRGEKGGSAAAGAAVNALVRLAAHG